jgi:hypothetical protein
MLDSFAAHAHGLWVLIEPRLRGLDNVFVFPTSDAALVGRCALVLERARPARPRQVNPHFLAIFARSCSCLNCPQHITPRFTEPKLEQALEPVIAHLRPGKRDQGAQSRQFLPGQRGESSAAEDEVWDT